MRTVQFLEELSSVFRSKEASSAQRSGCLSRNGLKNTRNAPPQPINGNFHLLYLIPIKNIFRYHSIFIRKIFIYYKHISNLLFL